MPSWERMLEARLVVGAAGRSARQRVYRLFLRPQNAVFDAYIALYTVDEADVCIPRNRIPEYVERAEAIGEKHGVLLVPVGHAGDGNLHYNIIKREETPMEEWPGLMEAALSDLIDMSHEMGGTASGEHGLGYTTFAYSDLSIDTSALATDGAVTVSFVVENTGDRAGRETPQVYVRDVDASVQRPYKELKGFAKVDLAAGESGSVSVTLNARAFSFYDETLPGWRIEPGQFEILVGASASEHRA